MTTSDELRCWVDHLRNWAVNAPLPKLRSELLRLAVELDAEALALDAKPSKRAKPHIARAGTASPGFPPSVW